MIARNTLFVSRSALSCIKSNLLPKNTFNSSVSLASYRYLSTSSSLNMKLVQYSHKGDSTIRVGFLEGDNVVEIHKVDSSLPKSLLDILKNGQIEKVKK